MSSIKLVFSEEIQAKVKWSIEKMNYKNIEYIRLIYV